MRPAKLLKGACLGYVTLVSDKPYSPPCNTPVATNTGLNVTAVQHYILLFGLGHAALTAHGRGRRASLLLAGLYQRVCKSCVTELALSWIMYCLHLSKLRDAPIAVMALPCPVVFC